MEDGLRGKFKGEEGDTIDVLILVVMEDGLRVMAVGPQVQGRGGLNPCCYGRWSQRAKNAM